MAAARSILIADDDPDIHNLLSAALADEGYTLDDANDGLQALSALELKPYDLVITDIRMPGLDGLQLLERIRQVRPDTRVLVMTAESTPATVIRSLQEQAFGYFSKPFSIDAVGDMVARALGTAECRGDIEVLSAIPRWIALRLRCREDVADRLVPFIQEIGTELTPEERADVATAFRELLMNAIEHGGHSDPNKTVRIDYIRTARSMLFKISDPGEGFSFDDLRHAAVANGPSTPFAHMEVRNEMGLRPGGFGILVSRNLADELIYNEKGNEVLLVKYLPRPEDRRP